MPTLIQRSLSGGELAPNLHSRVDIVKYQTGLKTLRNFHLMRSGGAQNRPGTQFVCQVKDSSKAVRVIEFVFTAGDAYCIEVGEEYFRFIRASATILSPIGDDGQEVASVTEADPGVFTITGHGFSDGDDIFFSGFSGDDGFDTLITGPRHFRIANATTDTFTLVYVDGTEEGDALDTSAFDMSSQVLFAVGVVTVTSPYQEDELFDLQFVQSGDTIIITHPNHAPRELSRTAVNAFTLSTITFSPGIAAPGSLAVSGSSGSVAQWVVTAILEDTYEESLAQTPVGADAEPSSGSPRTVSWAAVTDAVEYNVYRRTGTQTNFGLVAITSGLAYIDTGVTPSSTDSPPISRDPFPSSSNYPSTVTFVQQRLAFGATTNKPETVFMSRPGAFKNFTTRSPLQDDDSITFTIAGRQLNQVKHLLDLGKLVMLTSGGEWVAEGSDSGLTPFTLNLRQQSYHGANSIRPVVIGKEALFVQARSGIIRSLGFDFNVDGFRGNDMTIFASHLFDGYSVVDMAYQQTPHSILWVVRSDGALLGLTYIPEHEIFGWHRHDTDGEFESICSIPFQDRDVIYAVVKRTVDGATKRFIELLGDREFDDIRDAHFMDCSRLEFDGRGPQGYTATLSGGTTWEYGEELTLTLSSAVATSDEVGRVYHLRGASEEVLRFTVTGFTSSTVLTGTGHKTVPTDLRGVATSDFDLTTTELTGLRHLEGKEVSVFGDGFVVANPNNPAYDVLTVTDGAVTLPQPCVVVRVGLPYVSDIETLDIDTASGKPLIDQKKLVNQVRLMVEESRGIWIGPKVPASDAESLVTGLTEYKARSTEAYDDPVLPATGVIDVLIRGEWNSNGRILVRQVDPLAASVLAIAPQVSVAGGRG